MILWEAAMIERLTSFDNSVWQVFVKPEEVDDLESIQLARDIAKQIEESMQYPGMIKVMVIREKRAIDYAK